MNIFQRLDVDANLLNFVHDLCVNQNIMQNLNSELIYHKPKEYVSNNNRIENL